VTSHHLRGMARKRPSHKFRSKTALDEKRRVKNIQRRARHLDRPCDAAASSCRPPGDDRRRKEVHRSKVAFSSSFKSSKK
jgi:hypothetical protein